MKTKLKFNSLWCNHLLLFIDISLTEIYISNMVMKLMNKKSLSMIWCVYNNYGPLGIYFTLVANSCEERLASYNDASQQEL